MSGLTIPHVRHRHVDVDGLRVFYRETGPVDAPVLLLLHGFPSASHQFARLLDALGTRYRLITPDYPGFGHSDSPAPDAFAYRFDTLADVVEGFCLALALDRFALYVFDFGAPVGLRLATRRPEWITGLVVQNGNAYEDGLSDRARQFIANRRGVPGAGDAARSILTPEITRGQYEGGTGDPSLVAPDGWTLDQHFLDLPGRKDIQVELALDYFSNVERYPDWQAWLRSHQPPTRVLWGRNDPFFTEAGARAYLRDLPRAELHVFRHRALRTGGEAARNRPADRRLPRAHAEVARGRRRTD
ncbi:alpha/beta hydrolase [Kitasatospora sp. NPDC086791]|uniref:alpha/beta fold hydrolase n=1 Tax=Kitasatospora sp. NPDC086791 TaxID=3155178 RepID=UPI0034353619